MRGVALDSLKLEEYRLDELRKHQAALAAEIGLRESSSVTDRDRYMRAWHTAIMEVWSGKYGTKMPYTQWRRSAGKTLLAHLAGAEEFARKFFRGTPRDIEIHPARVLVVECLVQWMRERDLPIEVTHGTLAKNFQNAGQAVNFQLPGYAESGLLPMALRLKGTARR